VALLADCAARLVGAYTLPVTTMVWLSTVITLGSIGVAILVGGAAAGPIQEMIDAEAAAS
jgi:L-cystine uptake protein TcyP (sodium:dicarboxylate symporter family)